MSLSEFSTRLAPPARVPNPNSLVLTIRETAGELRLSEATVAERLARGDIPSVKIGKARRVRRADLEAYIAQLAPSLPQDEA